MYKVMIADDERIIRETIASMVDWNAHGFKLIGVCADGMEAFDFILDEYPDLVITDVKMPVLDGLGLIERIRQTGLDIEFIILSGFGEFEFTKQALELSVNQYVLKPINDDELIAMLHKAAKRLDEKFARINEQSTDKHIIKKILPLAKKQFLSEIADWKGNDSLDEKDIVLYESDYEYLIGLFHLEDEVKQGLLPQFLGHSTVRTDSTGYSSYIQKTLELVELHLSTPELSLKWLGEQFLYMNVNYLSKQFQKQTGEKFSAYLSRRRIEKAKELMINLEAEHIYTVAEQVGLGHNPRYFSQIFKKYTGLTPTEYRDKA